MTPTTPLQPDLTGQVALVTGAGRGIGKAIAQWLADRGALVLLAARTKAEIDSVANDIRSRGGRAFAHVVDLARPGEITKLFDALKRDHGRLDILINNAGIGRFGPTESFALTDWDAVFATNARGAFLCCQGALSMMRPQNRGYIINISSVVGFKGYPLQAAYTASKHAVMGMTKSIAAEVKDTNIRISAILPGGVETDMLAQARPDLVGTELLQPDDIAQAVLYLLSLSDRATVDEIYIRRRHSSPF
jgi:3-oxoacyl-[acyl-carrier protein] reductase